MALEEKGLKYRVIEESLAQPSEALLRINPAGEVPVLVHGEIALPESSAITEYLEELHPMPALMPDSPQGRARVRQWTWECSLVFKPDLDAFKYEWENLGPSERQGLLSRLERYLKRLETRLGSQEFLLGEHLTLADIHLFPFYRQLTRAKTSDPGLLRFPESLNSWLARIVSRPSFTRVMAKN